MAKTERSPGPWDRLNKGLLGERSARHEIVDATGRTVVRMPNLTLKCYANAALIAAAPGLLQACTDALDWLNEAFPGEPDLDEMKAQLRAAIEPAEDFD